MTKKLAGAVGALFLVTVLGGCATERTWAYRAEPPARTSPMVNKTVAVGPLRDMRENKNSSLMGLYAIPLMPYGWADYNTPEGAKMHLTSGAWLFRPNEDFAKAIAEELDNANIFEEVFFTYRASEGDLELTGEIESTFYHAKMYSYCVSIFAPYLWLVGFPVGSARNDLNLSFQLIDTKTGEVLWEKEYAKEEKLVTWLYAMKSDFLYDVLLKDIMKEVVPSLRNRFSRYSD